MISNCALPSYTESHLRIGKQGWCSTYALIDVMTRGDGRGSRLWGITDDDDPTTIVGDGELGVNS